MLQSWKWVLKFVALHLLLEWLPQNRVQPVAITSDALPVHSKVHVNGMKHKLNYLGTNTGMTAMDEHCKGLKSRDDIIWFL